MGEQSGIAAAPRLKSFSVGEGRACHRLRARFAPRKPSGNATIRNSVSVLSHPVDPRRDLAIEGAYNVRDLGGYQAGHGRTVKWRHVYRSDALGAATANDVELLLARGIRLVCDLRSGLERTAAPNPWIATTSIESWGQPPTEPVGDSRQLLSNCLVSAEATRTVMTESYRVIPFDQARAYSQVFRRLAARETPLLFHCFAGKDRSGVAAVLSSEAVEQERRFARGQAAEHLGIGACLVERNHTVALRHHRARCLRANEAVGQKLPRITNRFGWRLAPALDTGRCDPGIRGGGALEARAQIAHETDAAREQQLDVIRRRRAQRVGPIDVPPLDRPPVPGLVTAEITHVVGALDREVPTWINGVGEDGHGVPNSRVAAGFPRGDRARKRRYARPSPTENDFSRGAAAMPDCSTILSYRD